jgi:acyl-CoA hydrolase
LAHEFSLNVLTLHLTSVTQANRPPQVYVQLSLAPVLLIKHMDTDRYIAMTIFLEGLTMTWEEHIVSVERVLHQMRPGMSIFLGTGAAEPRTIVKHLMSSGSGNLQDLELIQLASFGEAISLPNLQAQKFRLKTFFSGWVADEAITAGQVDLIPSHLYRIPKLIEQGQISVDAAFVQITAPDSSGYCSLGIAVDVARVAMDQAQLVVGEINADVPRTFGDTYIHRSDFNYFVMGEHPPIYFPRWPATSVYDGIAENIEPLIEDKSCVAFSVGPLFDALGRKLMTKKNLGVHSPIFSDSLMDLVKCGAVTNRYKELFRGQSLTSYACGTPELIKWLHQNPMVEFQAVDKVCDPIQIGRNPNFVAVIPAKKVDLTGRVALHTGSGHVASGPAEVIDFFVGTQISEGGFSVFGLPSRNHENQANIILSIKGFKNRIDSRETIDFVVTEFGMANLKGLTLRERAQALIDVAHPNDRAELISLAKREKILYPDQIYLEQRGRHYPVHINEVQTFKNNIQIRFRPIKPSDEEQMRRLFYRFSDEAVYYRYFSSVKTMPHAKMQAYVNVDWANTMSLVGLEGKPGQGRIIAEARFLCDTKGQWAEVAFVVDEAYQNIGISSYLFKVLVRIARDQGLKGFYAEVLSSNAAMMKVFKKSGLVVHSELDEKVYKVTIAFNSRAQPA